MGRLDDITLEELYDLKDQIDEGKPREHASLFRTGRTSTNGILLGWCSGSGLHHRYLSIPC